jgi:hypothetical protein
VSGGSPRKQLDAYVDALRRSRNPPAPAQLTELRRLWEAADAVPEELVGAFGSRGLWARRPPPRWEVLEAEFGPPPEKTGPARRGAKELGIPEREMWWIIERWLENSHAHSRESLAQETKRRQDLEYVPRPRLSPLVDWMERHREAAERAARLHEIPAEFRAGKLGPVPPSR